jgi:hypothetical protein
MAGKTELSFTELDTPTTINLMLHLSVHHPPLWSIKPSKCCLRVTCVSPLIQKAVLVIGKNTESTKLEFAKMADEEECAKLADEEESTLLGDEDDEDEDGQSRAASATNASKETIRAARARSVRLKPGYS